MKCSKYQFATILSITLMFLGSARAAEPAPEATTHVIVTAEARKGGSPPAIRQGDVMMYQKRDRLPVSTVQPLAGSPTELYVAVDEAIGTSFGTQLPDVKKFITGQPASVAVGVAYLHDGTVSILQKPTTDHVAAAKTLRLPTPGVGISVFESIVDLVKQWPETQARREMVLISSGIEPYGPTSFSNPYVDEAVATVQKQGIPVFAIYLRPGGHWGHTSWRTMFAQAYLSQLGDESGGEGYNLSGVVVVTIGPFLDKINQRLQNQYRVAFTPNAPEKPGFVPIRATTEVPNVDLVTQDRVWVGGAE